MHAHNGSFWSTQIKICHSIPALITFIKTYSLERTHSRKSSHSKLCRSSTVSSFPQTISRLTQIKEIIIKVFLVCSFGFWTFYRFGMTLLWCSRDRFHYFTNIVRAYNKEWKCAQNNQNKTNIPMSIHSLHFEEYSNLNILLKFIKLYARVCIAGLQ